MCPLFPPRAPSSAVGSDKIAINAKSVFEKAGGTSKSGLSQKQLQAADALIAAALDRLTRDGTIGGATLPAVVGKPDLFKKEKITFTEFLDYFRGLASERDLKDSSRFGRSGIGATRGGPSGC